MKCGTDVCADRIKVYCVYRLKQILLGDIVKVDTDLFTEEVDLLRSHCETSRTCS